jgi:hypothetical protein
MIGRQPVHLADAVVHAVEPPQQRNLVRGTVSRVAPHCGDRQSRDNLHPTRARGDCGTEGRGNKGPQHGADHRHRDDDSNLECDPIDQVVHHVGAPPAPQYLARVQREQALQWDEDDCQDDDRHHDSAAHA